MKKTLNKAAFIGILVLLTSCTLLKKETVALKGDGNIQSQEFPINDYSKVTLSGNQELIYEQRADLDPYLRIETDDNLLRFITPKVKKNELALESVAAVAPTSYKIFTNSRALTELTLTGSGKAYLEGNLNVKNLNLNITGSGSIFVDNVSAKNLSLKIIGAGYSEISGTISKATFDLTGNGKIKADKLQASTVICKLPGAGSMWVYATDELRVNISGSGNVYYAGSPLEFKQKLSGIGTVSKMD
ncbi:MAG: head GIN domain-containing protein [Dysgonomonas sp.]